MKRKDLENQVRKLVTEAAKQGKMQKVYRKSFASMIDKAEEGDNPNTPPFTKKAAGPGRSGPVVENGDYLNEGILGVAKSSVEKGLSAIANEYKSASSGTGKLLRKLFGGEKLEGKEKSLLAKSLDTLSVPAIIIGFLLGGKAIAGVIMILSILAQSFALDHLDPKKYIQLHSPKEDNKQSEQ